MKCLLTYLFFVFSLGFIINLTNINLSHALFEKGICASNTYGSQIKVKYSYSGKCKDLGAFFISKNDVEDWGTNSKETVAQKLTGKISEYFSDNQENEVV